MIGLLARRRCRLDGHTLAYTSESSDMCNYNRYWCTRCGWTDTWVDHWIKVASKRPAREARTDAS